MNALARAPFPFVAWLVGLCLTVLPDPAGAEVNSARGGIGGIDNGTLLNGDGTGAARITIQSVPLALVKQARAADGAVLPDGTGVTPGQQIWFLLWVDNPTPHPASDIRITDNLDESQFTLIPGTLEEAVVPTGSDADALWNATWIPRTDTVGNPGPDDVVSALDTGGPTGPDRVTVGAVPGQLNLPFRIPGGSLGAIRFRVRVE